MKMDAARLHTIYALLLAHCFRLVDEDLILALREWGPNIYGEEIEWPHFSFSEDVIAQIPGGNKMTAPRLQTHLRSLAEKHPLHLNNLREKFSSLPREPMSVKVCSMPSELEKLNACEELSQIFDLEGVPGFYRDDHPLPGESPRAEFLRDFGPWRLNLPYKSGLLAPYDNGTGYILGLRIYLFTAKRRGVASAFRRNVYLLSSRGLPYGASAIAFREGVAA